MDEFSELIEYIEDNPVIMAVKDWEGLNRCTQMEPKVVFILFGDICNISEIVRTVKKANKIAIVHVDLITGLGNREVVIDFMKENTMLDGIISTKPALIKRAKELGVFAIFRYFLLDSMALENLRRQETSIAPDMIEILPGVMPKVTRHLAETLNVPIICGGLISDKSDVMNALNAGATAISSTNKDVWVC
ncbi:MAG: glycerol-3-phosphate responsive antiterminator [Lachnospiraceae bacterium]|nr:glycerol-3-phosphate responsive antiterminator [Lachnospiraceae bacterium]